MVYADYLLGFESLEDLNRMNKSKVFTSVYTQYGYVRSLAVPAKIAVKLKLTHKDVVEWTVNEDRTVMLRKQGEKK